MPYTTGLHHFHKRKRVYQNLEPYPHPEKWKGILDRLIYVVAIFGPLVTLPQIYDVYKYQNVQGLSLITWIGYFIASVFWLIYGIAHKEKPIIFMNVLWIIIHGLIITGIFIFG